jgi:multiple sugar transport system substrate-binding protein
MELLEYSPPDILSMSWYERVRPYAAGKVAMAYGYTLLAPYFELDETSPAHGNTGYLPHPHGPRRAHRAGRRLCAVHSGQPAEDRIADAVEALVAFTSPGAQKLYVQNGSRTAPRYSVGADPEVRRLSTIFEPSTRCPGATSCSSGRARRSRRSPRSSICGEPSFTTCCAAS